MNDDPASLASNVVSRLRGERVCNALGHKMLMHEAAEEIERLARERDQLLSAIGEHVTVRSDQYAEIQRLRAALRDWCCACRCGWSAEVHDQWTASPCVQCAPIRALLSGEPHPKRAYYETHEPPHCPTCDCGRSSDETCGDGDENSHVRLTGLCDKCRRTWTIYAEPRTDVIVKAFHCQCGHTTVMD